MTCAVAPSGPTDCAKTGQYVGGNREREGANALTEDGIGNGQRAINHHVRGAAAVQFGRTSKKTRRPHALHLYAVHKRIEARGKSVYKLASSEPALSADFDISKFEILRGLR